eukprot:15454474-Alexandrium_andersonii.AAC.1
MAEVALNDIVTSTPPWARARWVSSGWPIIGCTPSGGACVKGDQTQAVLKLLRSRAVSRPRPDTIACGAAVCACIVDFLPGLSSCAPG